MVYARYWDLSNKERSELTSDQVEAFVDAELMERGVVRVEAPVLLPVESPDLPAQKLFVLKRGYVTCTTHGYRTAEAAAKAMQDAVAIDSEYVGGTSYHTIGKRDDSLTIETLDVYVAADVANIRKTAEQMAANKKANDKAMAEYRDACKAVEDVLSGLWEDYRECQAEARKNQKIVDTFKAYTKTAAGNESIAAEFLKKVYQQTEIDAAFEWFGIQSPLSLEAPV